MPMGQPQGLPLRRRGDTNLVGAGLVPARFACCNHISQRHLLLIPPQVPVDGNRVDRLTRNQVVHCQRHIDGELA